MINNIYELEDGKQYAVIMEKNIDDKKYVLISECDYDNDSINEDELLLKELTFSDGNLLFKNVEDKDIENILHIMLSNND